MARINICDTRFKTNVRSRHVVIKVEHRPIESELEEILHVSVLNRSRSMDHLFRVRMGTIYRIEYE